MYYVADSKHLEPGGVSFVGDVRVRGSILL